MTARVLLKKENLWSLAPSALAPIRDVRWEQLWLLISYQWVKLLLAFVSTVIPGFSLLDVHGQEFNSPYTCPCLQMGPPFRRQKGSVFLCVSYDCCTAVSARAYPNCPEVQDSMDPLHCTEQHLCKGFLPILPCAAGYTSTCLTTPKLQLFF
jgi:hypothetical protein